jgi:hypothetical protein
MFVFPNALFSAQGTMITPRNHSISLPSRLQFEAAPGSAPIALSALGLTWAPTQSSQLARLRVQTFDLGPYTAAIQRCPLNSAFCVQHILQPLKARHSKKHDHVLRH